MGRTARKRQQLKKCLQISNKNNFIPGLYKYLHAKGWQNQTQLCVANFIRGGRGLCSKTITLNNNDELIRLPYECLLTINTLESDFAFKARFDSKKFEKDRKCSFQALMAFYLIYQQHLGDASNIFSYLQSIPTHFTTPFFCETNELHCLPDAILVKVVEQNRKIRNFYNVLCEMLKETDDKDTMFTISAFKWAYFVVNTRSVYINKMLVKPIDCYFTPLLIDAPDLGLAPLLDLFNHSSEVTTSAELLKCNGSNSQLWEYSIKLISTPNHKVLPYNQLFISYGALTNLRLLLEYGFTLSDNYHDYFEFSLLDIENMLKEDKAFTAHAVHRNKFKFIRDHNLDDQMFVHPHDGMSHNLHVVLHLIFKESSHFTNVLQQVAFGSTENLDDMKYELNRLLALKIAEYQTFLNNIRKRSELSDSILVVRDYMNKCINLLERALR